MWDRICVDCKAVFEHKEFKKCEHCRDRDQSYRERAIQEDLMPPEIQKHVDELAEQAVDDYTESRHVHEVDIIDDELDDELDVS